MTDPRPLCGDCGHGEHYPAECVLTVCKPLAGMIAGGGMMMAACGCKPKPAIERPTQEVMALRFTRQQYDAIESAAILQGCSMGDFVLAAGLAMAEEAVARAGGGPR